MRIILCGWILLVAHAQLAHAQVTRIASVDSAGVPGSGFAGSISSDGRWVGFVSRASNLVPGDDNLASDVFVHDLLTGVTERVSVSSSGQQGNADCSYYDVSGHYVYSVRMSANGRFVAFYSESDNLVPGDTNGCGDVFIRDRVSGTMTRVSVSSHGVEGNGVSRYPAISDDGRMIAFESAATNFESPDTNGVIDVFVHDRDTGRTFRVSETGNGLQGDNTSHSPAMSGDGTRVAFISRASNFVVGDGRNREDIFVRNLATGAMRCATIDIYGSVANSSAAGPQLSRDGNLVLFSSSSPELVVGDTNWCSDIFLRDVERGVTTRLSVSSTGAQGSSASLAPSMSSDGRYISFTSASNNLVPGDLNSVDDVFRHDILTGLTIRVDLGTMDEEGNRGGQTLPECNAMSATGGRVAFMSYSTNFGAFTSNASSLFVRDLSAPNLRVLGEAPGTVDVTIRNLPPGGAVFLLRGRLGISQAPSTLCAGVRLELDAPSVLATLVADASGLANTSLQTPLQAIGMLLQALSPESCNRSNIQIVPTRVLSLTRQGACRTGSPVILNVTEATPGTTLALLWGGHGSSTLGVGRCAGALISIASPHVLAVLQADAAGSASFSFLPLPIMCGDTFQAIQEFGCLVSNTIYLP